ncbi:Mucin-2 [Acipenser ruthenus]|uniref:Mucin-2 n=1 Tax=Acipenser ruthenus TaxID=7906 RepID=A0A444U2W2_ACIRT|nr:Mucin-2 [Acipenser ruthenus]
MLTARSWSDCSRRLNLESYIHTCMLDMCSCTAPKKEDCICSTLSEFSRQCSHAGGKPDDWRTDTLCPKSCPFNMIYKESGSPCVDTCSNRDTSTLCEEHLMDGCFCPEGELIGAAE